jgi:hypothetical protein
MKEEHELRIELATEATPDMQSEIIFYGANVGAHPAPVNFRECASAMTPSRYPASSRGISLGWTNSAIDDRRPEYWSAELAQLCAQYARQIAPRLADKSLTHLSVFALAPQPLLMRLGHLLSELPAVDVYQRRRSPQTWRWADHAPEITYLVDEPDRDRCGPLALVLSLSATINNERITSVLGGDATIWRLRVAQPDQDFLTTREHLAAFRRVVRNLLDRINAAHGQTAVLNVFPAMPVSAAVEFGRVIQPKADIAMEIYDQQQAKGFVRTIPLNSPAQATLN